MNIYEYHQALLARFEQIRSKDVQTAERHRQNGDIEMAELMDKFVKMADYAISLTESFDPDTAKRIVKPSTPNKVA
jgi:hypothetical protein